MPNKMERFTQNARYILSLAQEAAEDLKNPEINIVHVLLAMTRLETSNAFNVLNDHDIIEAKLLPFVKNKTDTFFGDGQHSGFLDLSNDLKKALELAVDTARRFGHSYIESAHLLIGVLRCKSDKIESILEHFDVSAKDVIKRAEYYLHDEASDEYQVKKRTIQYLSDKSNSDEPRGCGEMLNRIPGLSGKRKNDE